MFSGTVQSCVMINVPGLSLSSSSFEWIYNIIYTLYISAYFGNVIGK